MKKTLSLISAIALPLAAFSIDNISGTLGLSTGYRFDSWKMDGTSSGTEFIEKIQRMEGLSTELNGRVNLDRIYLRARGSWFWVLNNPQYLAKVGGASSTTQTLTKEYGYNADGAIGYAFFWGCDLFSLAPEAGYSYQSLDITKNVTISTGSPFVGVVFGAKVSPDWYFSAGLDYHFLGSNSTELHSTSNVGLAKVDKGTYMGPQLNLTLDYVVADHWAVGLGYDLKYLFTTTENYTSTIKEKTRWMTNTASLNVSYTF